MNRKSWYLFTIQNAIATDHLISTCIDENWHYTHWNHEKNVGHIFIHIQLTVDLLKAMVRSTIYVAKSSQSRRFSLKGYISNWALLIKLYCYDCIYWQSNDLSKCWKCIQNCPPIQKVMVRSTKGDHIGHQDAEISTQLIKRPFNLELFLCSLTLTECNTEYTADIYCSTLKGFASYDSGSLSQHNHIQCFHR